MNRRIMREQHLLSICLLFLLLPSLALNGSASLASDLDTSDKVHKAINEIKAKVDSYHQTLFSGSEAQVSHLAILFGKPGVGKTTLFNLLAGKNIVVKKNGRNFVLHAVNPVEGSCIGHGLNSATFAPVFWHDPVSKIVFCDFAGMPDTRKNYDIVHAYILDYVCQKFSNIVLILTIAEACFSVRNQRGESVREDIAHISEFFTIDTISTAAKAVSLIIADGPSNSAEIKTDFETILQEHGQALERERPRALRLLTQLINAPITCTPSVRPGTLIDSPYLDDTTSEAVRRSIIEGVLRSTALTGEIKLRASIGEHSQRDAIHLAQKLAREVEKENRSIEGVVLS